MSGALNSFLSGTATILDGASKVISRGALRTFLENLQVFLAGFTLPDKKPSEEFKKALALNCKVLLKQLLHKGSNDIKEVLIDAFGADLATLESDSSPEAILIALWAAFKKPNAKAASELKSLMSTIRLIPTNIDFRGNYQKIMQLFVEYDEVVEVDKFLSKDEKFLILSRALGNSFIEHFVVVCSVNVRELSYDVLKKCLDDLLKIKFEHRNNETGLYASNYNKPIKREPSMMPTPLPKKAKVMPKARFATQKTGTVSSIRCFRCGASTHLSNVCPHKDKQCNICGGPHLKLMCKKKNFNVAQANIAEFAFIANEEYINLDEVNSTPIFTGSEPADDFIDFPPLEDNESDVENRNEKKWVFNNPAEDEELIDYEAEETEEPQYV